ncbi:FAD-dependent oxidoreductase [bacterium]|nr:FAD-dependent oxidoreductase [bacterium]
MSRLEKKSKITVLGGGISGLWAAYTLLKSNPNLAVTVLEKKDQPGGLFNSSNRCGFHFNHGLFLFPETSPLIKMFPHRFSPVAVSYDKFVGDRLLRFPVDPSEMKAIARLQQILPFIKHMSRRTTLNMSGYKPSNLDEWLKLNLPDSWSEQFRINDYVYKLMGYESWELSRDVGIQRLEYIVRMLRPVNIARHLNRRVKMMVPRKNTGIPPTQVHHQWLNNEGTGGFIKEFAEHICTMGAHIETNVQVQQIIKNNQEFQILMEDRDPINSDLFISTIPVVEFAKYRTNGSGETKRLKWRNLALFFFKLKYSMPDDNPWVIYSFDRKQCWKRAVVRRIDDKYSAVRVEITGNQSSEDNHEQLKQNICENLTGILQVSPEKWIEWDAIDVPYGYPCLLNEYEQDYSALEDKILVPGLYSLGRQGKHRYATSSICANMIKTDVTRIIAHHNLS